MPKNKRKFIDKKNAVTFTLAERPTNDPLLDDVNAPQSVLTLNECSSEPVENRLKQLRSFGIYYDDDYDYLQHLRGVDEDGDTNKLMLPSTTFSFPVDASHVDDTLDMEQFFDAELDEEMTAAERSLAPGQGTLEDNFLELAENGEDEPVIDVNKTDLLQRYFGEFAAIDVRPRPSLDLMTSAPRLANEERFSEESSVCSGQFSDASEDEDEDEEEFLRKESEYLGRPLTVKEEVDLRKYREMLRDIQLECEVGDVDRNCESVGGLSSCSLATQQAMEKDRTTLFSRAPLLLEVPPDEKDELMIATRRLISEQSDGSDPEVDPVDEWVERDRRVELEHDVTSYHLERDRHKVRRCQDMKLVPNASDGDAGVVLEGVEAVRRLTECSASVQEIEHKSESVTETLQSVNLTREQDESPQQRRERKRAVKDAKRERLENRKQRREIFEQARRNRHVPPAPGTSGVKCRLVPLS